MDEPAFHLDMSGLDDSSGEQEAASPSGQSLANRPWVGVHFDCCSVYTRLYRSADGTVYRGVCPRCLRRVTLRVGPDGTSARFFVAR